MATAIGVVGSAIGILSFIIDLVPEQPEASKQSFKFHVGLDGTSNGDGDSELTEAGGGIANIKVYDSQGQEISNGEEHSIDIADGNHGDIEVTLEEAKQGVTTEFYASNDAICIAAITTTWDDDQSFGFTGDWRNICDGLLGYPSGIELELEGGGSESPDCIWIDGNGDAGEAVVIAMHWGAVSTDDGDTEAKCGRGGGFRAWRDTGRGDDDMIAFPPEDYKKRSVKAGASHSGRRDNRLVISDKKFFNHQATTVCDKPNSFGPDFVSTYENMYCNMSNREVLPLCGTETDQGGECFDLEEAYGRGPAKRAPGRIARALGARQTKAPSRIVDWTSGN